MTGRLLESAVLVEGLALGESPRWHGGRLWLSDWMAGEVLSVDSAGRVAVEFRMKGLPFCFDWLPDGRMVIVDNSAGRKVLCREGGDGLVTYADLAGVDEHPWNEIVVDGQGNAYVNGIGFDMMAGEEPSTGVIALVTPEGTVRQVADELYFPNGMVITADGSTLIVSESHAKRLTAFDIRPDGSLGRRRVWAEVDGHPDGICLDAAGSVWCAAMTGCLLIAEGGAVLAEVPLDRSPFACALGGPDGSTLYIVAARWEGTEGMDVRRRTGQVLTARAPAPRP
ncbi:SMP-30/gluconolactonase/LRE family protein [Nocardia yamanashiensis]|uniref:SMP-30/gluconolactonase/LRE family protein n=1 Tax=Nocardia yamanashiensis TaxID=209247 RepID=UPI001E2F8C39|nr:SMP-30/gluconolactonase/LRE family protein [Nocardia yamanashiensis]UGT44641.1 SMP-30/gluconolactonase/LRE family protein [Nocardia yamanashiensis]